MRCPYCSMNNDKVGDTRTSTDGFVVRRRRTCRACGRKFTTFERIEVTLRVIKRDGSQEPYDRKKLQEGLEHACRKRLLQDSEEKILTLIAQVERDIISVFETEVESRFIGERVMHYLSELDQVAYVRFASVYRDFKDAEDFVRELQRMEQNPEMPCLSSEYIPKKKTSRFPKAKRSRYGEHGLLEESSEPPS